MDIKTLESFSLGDAIFFHDELNKNLWDKNNEIRPEVKNQLLIIAKDFLEELGIKDLDVKDVTVSGSNAAYTYTKHSDLDLHILVDMSKLPDNEVYRELFTAKKNLYNDSHDITVHGVPVELYVQDSNEPVVSLGEYSLLKNKWLRIPTKRRANFDQTITKQKYDKLLDIIQRALKSKDLEKVQDIITTIKRYRKAGLDKGGEFGPENLAYKALRTQGYIDKLYNLRDKLHSIDLSIEENILYKDPKQLIDLYLRKIEGQDLSKYTLTKILKNLPYNNLDNAINFLSKKYQVKPTDIVWQPSDKTNEDFDPNGPPPGPEFKPTMPKGTVRVDVSDVYDWYKLGQHISNMKGLGKHDFGKGPPSTILSFGDEDIEHQYIKDLEKTGLTTTDIDPIDPHQPKGMKRQKVDPTFNVNEKINPNIIKPDFRQEKIIQTNKGPIKLIATPPIDSGEIFPQFDIKGYNQNKILVAHLKLNIRDLEKFNLFMRRKDFKNAFLVAANVEVNPEYQKLGIAREMYRFAQELGNDIKPSETQTKAGKAMWRSFDRNNALGQNVNELAITPDRDNGDTREISWKEFYNGIKGYADSLGLYNMSTGNSLTISFHKNFNLDFIYNQVKDNVTATVLSLKPAPLIIDEISFDLNTVDLQRALVYIRTFQRRGNLKETINLELWKGGKPFQSHFATIGGYQFEAKPSIREPGSEDENYALMILVRDPKLPKGRQIIGHAEFAVNDHGTNQWLESDGTTVNEKYRGKNIAYMMYAYAKSLGNDISPSFAQTTMGKKMWAGWGKDAKNLMKEGVDYMGGHCHVMALALKQLHPSWKLKAHIGYEDDAEDDNDYKIDHIFVVDPETNHAYDCRGKFNNEQELITSDNYESPYETQIVDYSAFDIANDIKRGELKNYSKADIENAIKFIENRLSEDLTNQFASEKTPAINPYGGLKDTQFRGAISEMPDTSGPVGVQPGGWRVYRPKITEAFDQPYKLKWEKSDYGDYDAYAKLDDGTYLSIMFNNEYKKNWMVEFYRNNSQAVTGEGDAQRIFATVLHAIQQFIKKKKPTSLFFSAVKEDDPTGSRTKLYDRLVQRFATGLGYTVQKQEESGSNSYKLKRIENVNKGVAENLEQKMSVNDTLAYLQKVMGTTSHEDWRNHIINTNEYFVLKEVPVSSLKSDLSGLNKDNIEKYKQMDFSKAPPIVIGSDGNILDGYHRVNVAKALKVPTLKAWVGVKKQGVAEGSKQFNKCFDKACQLYDKALEKDLNPILYQVADYQGSAENANSKWLKLPKHVWSHYVTVIGDTVYDPTATQFGPKKETKYSLDKLKTEWGKIYKIRPKELEESASGYSNTTFQIKRRKLNVPALIKAGAIFVTYPHGEQGWETDNKEDWAYSLISLYNVMQGGWPSEAKKYVKPTSYKKAEQQINSSAPNLGSDQLVYDGKYNQILWSIKKLGIPDNVAFLDKGQKEVAESASGYIPSNAESNDPRFKTALTVDIKPDTMKKDAKKFGNKISRAGIPPTLRADGKF